MLEDIEMNASIFRQNIYRWLLVLLFLVGFAIPVWSMTSSPTTAVALDIRSLYLDGPEEGFGG